MIFKMLYWGWGNVVVFEQITERQQWKNVVKYFESKPG